MRSPYLSTWQPSTVAPGTWESFWNGNVTAMAGIARIDGASYMFAGDPLISLDVPNGGYGQQTTVNDFEAALDQTGLQVTPTRSVFTLEGGGVRITLEYLSPIEPGDLRRQSIPLAWVLVSAQSIDGSAHDVSVFLDISGEWLSGDANDQFTWAPATVPYQAPPRLTGASPEMRGRSAGRTTKGCVCSGCARPTGGPNWRSADYLVANLPDLGFQNQTDDFAGFIAHSVNLALKGIIAVAAMGQIEQTVGQSADATHYGSQAQQFIAYWIKNAQDPSGRHLDLTYNGSGDGDGTWGSTYNAFPDALLGTGLVPESLAAEQAAFYPTVTNMFGLPLQIPHSYAKSDWQMWLAAWLRHYPISRELIERVYLYANTTPNRVPFSDLYSTISGDQVGFQARPVQGGIFSLLALQALERRRQTHARRGPAPRSRRHR